MRRRPFATGPSSVGAATVACSSNANTSLGAAGVDVCPHARTTRASPSTQQSESAHATAHMRTVVTRFIGAFLSVVERRCFPQPEIRGVIMLDPQRRPGSFQIVLDHGPRGRRLLHVELVV